LAIKLNLNQIVRMIQTLTDNAETTGSLGNALEALELMRIELTSSSSSEEEEEEEEEEEAKIQTHPALLKKRRKRKKKNATTLTSKWRISPLIHPES